MSSCLLTSLVPCPTPPFDHLWCDSLNIKGWRGLGEDGYIRSFILHFLYIILYILLTFLSYLHNGFFPLSSRKSTPNFFFSSFSIQPSRDLCCQEAGTPVISPEERRWDETVVCPQSQGQRGTTQNYGEGCKFILSSSEGQMH